VAKPGVNRPKVNKPRVNKPRVNKLGLDVPGVLSAEGARAALDSAGSGASELLGALVGAPLIVVDLDSPSGQPLRVPELLPAVVVGISMEAPDQAEIGRGLDVLLTGRRGAERPWIGGLDVVDELAALAAAVEADPIASTALAQVLRVGEGTPVTTRLALESLAYSTLQAGPEFAAWDAGRPPPIPGPPDADPVLFEIDGHVLRVTLNRPRVHNAYNAAMRDRLCEALSLAAADPTITEVHLHGAGPSFCSGGDLKEFGSREEPASAHLIRTGRSPARLLSVLSPKVTAHLHGFCVGSGIELPAFAGRVLADPGSTFRLPEIAMGLIPGAGGTASLPLRIGRQRTAWMALAGRAIDADTALDWGLVDEIVEAPRP
jgi:enoyl-CoA hydratase/carnithine racemase